MIKIQSSYRLIKSKYILEDTEKSLLNLDYDTNFIESFSPKIDDEYEIKEVILNNDRSIKEGREIESINNGVRENIESKILREIEEDRNRIINNAKKEAKKIKEEAEEKGYKDAFDRGLEEGYSEGLEKIEKDMKESKDKALDLIVQAEEITKDYFLENKNNLIKLAVDMAESIVGYSIDEKEEGILNLIKPIVTEYNKKEKITITCHPKQYEFLKDNLSKLESISPDTKFFIFRDGNLGEKDCLIENEDQLIDLTIKKQLDSIVNTIRHME